MSAVVEIIVGGLPSYASATRHCNEASDQPVADSFTFTGTGTVASVGGIRALTNVKSDRSIHAGVKPGKLTGSATIDLKVNQGVWTVIQINDTNPSAVCKCL